jgi:WD40 repeat protein
MLILQGARERVDCVRISPDGCSLLAPFSRGVQVWDRLVDQSGPTSILNYTRVRHIQFTPDGNRLILNRVGASTIVIHTLETGKSNRVPSGGRTATSGLSPHGDLVAIARNIVANYSEAGRLCCRSLSKRLKPLWSIHTRRIYHPPLFLEEGRKLLCMEYPQYLVVRDALTGEALDEMTRSLPSFGSTTVTSADGRLIAWRGEAQIVLVRSDNLREQPLVLRNDNPKGFTDLAFHPSGRYLAATSNDRTVKLYDTTSGAIVTAFNWEIGRLRSITFSADGTLAAAGAVNGHIVLWDVDL